MKQLKLVLLIISTVLLTQVAVAASNYLVTESAPVYPGDTTYVYVPIKNMGFGSFMEDVYVRLAPKDNSSADAVTLLDDIYSLGTINNWGDQRTAKFRLHVNPDAVEGDYYFDIYITYKGQGTGEGSATPATTRLENRVLTIKGKPLVVLLNSTLGIVEPMSINKEKLRLKNAGTGTIQNAVAEISLGGGDMKSAFSILGGGTQYSLGNLKPGDEVEITFDLAVDIAARPGVYNLPLKITGQNNYSSSEYVGLVVAGTTDFEITYQETMGAFSLNVANVGVNPASAVMISLPAQKNFSLTGSSSAVIGNLNPGDYTSSIFQLTKKTGAGNGLNVDIQYTDTSGKRHTITKSLTVELSSAAVQAGAGYRGSGSRNYTAWLLIIAIVSVAYWQRRRMIAYYQQLTGHK